MESSGEEGDLYAQDINFIRAMPSGVECMKILLEPYIRGYLNMTDWLSKPVRGVIPLDLAIKLEDADLVKYFMDNASPRVVSRGGDDGEQVKELADGCKNEKVREIVHKKCKKYSGQLAKSSKPLEVKDTTSAEPDKKKPLDVSGSSDTSIEERGLSGSTDANDVTALGWAKNLTPQ